MIMDMYNETMLIRKPTDRCFEETMKRVVKADNENGITTDLKGLIRATLSDYCDENPKLNSKLIRKMYQYCISEFKMKNNFAYIKQIASSVMEYDDEYLRI